MRRVLAARVPRPRLHRIRLQRCAGTLIDNVGPQSALSVPQEPEAGSGARSSALVRHCADADVRVHVHVHVHVHNIEEPA